MTQRSMPWSGSSTGDCGPYTSTQWQNMYGNLFGGGAKGVTISGEKLIGGENSGVLPHYSQGLRLEEIAMGHVRVKPGAAMVDGTYYETDSDVDILFSSNGYYTLVLRKDWVAQTVRVYLIGPGVSEYPDPVQSAGVTWDMPLAHLHYAGSNPLPMTDQRKLAIGSGTIDRIVCSAPVTAGQHPRLGIAGTSVFEVPGDTWTCHGTISITISAGSYSASQTLDDLSNYSFVYAFGDYLWGVASVRGDQTHMVVAGISANGYSINIRRDNTTGDVSYTVHYMIVLSRKLPLLPASAHP